MIKQQRTIRAFLRETFGPDRGSVIFDRQQRELSELLTPWKNASRHQKKALAGTILPPIALYKAMLAENCPDAYGCLRTYMQEKVSRKQHGSMVHMEKVPGFFDLYSSFFRKVMAASDLWDSTQRAGRDFFDVTISHCLWHRACVESGCGELCRLFCEADNGTYDGLRKIGFTRTGTLGCGGECCDFHFFRKNK